LSRLTWIKRRSKREEVRLKSDIELRKLRKLPNIFKKNRSFRSKKLKKRLSILQL
jgi:hypothetical protein